MSKLNEEKLKFSSKTFHVKEVCTFLGITPRVLKHYEDKGVLSPAREQVNSYRTYTAEDIIKVQIAEQLKQMGLPLNEIQQYFSGNINLNSLYERLIVQRDLINKLLSFVEMEKQIGKPKFEIFEETTQLCYVKEYSATNDLLQKYLDSRDAYSCAISVGCRCDRAHSFFIRYDGLFSYFNAESCEQVALDQKFVRNEKIDKAVYRVCVPILSAPKKLSDDGRVEEVTRKKSLIMKMVGEPLDGGKHFLMVAEEAKKRGFRLTENAWIISETGPNKKTAERTYSLVVAIEIE